MALLMVLFMLLWAAAALKEESFGDLLALATITVFIFFFAH